MSYQTSQRITNFFAGNEHLDGFWDFIHESGCYDEQQYEGGDRWDDFDNGFDLARAAGDKPVFVHDVSVHHKDASDLNLYFIGTEDEVVARLEEKLAAWLKKYPQETENERKLSALRKSRELKELQLQIAQSDLERIQKEEASLLSSSEMGTKKKSKKAKE